MEIDTLRCQKIELVNQKGECRMVLHATDDRGIIMLLGDTTHLEISASEQFGAQIQMTTMTDKNSVPRIIIGSFKNDSAGLIIRDSKGLARIVAGYDGDQKKAKIQCDDKILTQSRETNDSKP